MGIGKVFLKWAMVFTTIGVLTQLFYFIGMSGRSLISYEKETLKIILLALPFSFGVSSIFLMHYLNEKKYWFSLVTWILVSLAFLVFSIFLYQAEIERDHLGLTGMTFTLYLFLLAIHCFGLLLTKSKERKFLRWFGIICGCLLAILGVLLSIKLGNKLERQLMYYALLIIHVSGFMMVLNYYFELNPQKEEEIVNDDIIDAE